MKRLTLLAMLPCIALFLAGTAGAAPINWEGTAIIDLGDFPPARIAGGGVATITTTGSHVDSLRIAASRGAINGTFTRLVTDPETISDQVFVIQYIGLDFQTGTLTPISGGLDPAQTGFNGRLPVGGLLKLCLLNTECSVTADLELTQPDPTRPGGIKGVGIGGLLTINFFNGFANVSIEAKPWQIAQATVVDQVELPTPNNNITFVDIFVRGFAHGPSSASSTTAAVPTASAGGGVIQLIAPSQVKTNLTTGTNDKIAGGQTLLIRFIPEPGLLLLLGTAMAGLAMLGRGRMRD